MASFLSNGLVSLGICLLIAALFPLRRLVRSLPSGSLCRQWRMLSGVVCLVTTGYVVYGVGHWGQSGRLTDLVVPMVFFLGACFILAVSAMSLQTAHDMRRIATLELENITDPLMGIWNRRHMERRIEEEVARARRHGLPLAILLIDIDHFKEVNDTYGHQVGDQALSAIGKLICSTVRIPDIVARYGGEEIVVVTPDTPADPATILAERLRQDVEAAELVPPGPKTRGKAVRVTVSIGVATLTPDIDSVRKFLDEADQALYQAKSAGRNKVVVIGSSPAPSK